MIISDDSLERFSRTTLLNDPLVTPLGCWWCVRRFFKYHRCIFSQRSHDLPWFNILSKRCLCNWEEYDSLRALLYENDLELFLCNILIRILHLLQELLKSCIDDVAIRHSFVSRNYGRELTLCATIFCFSKFDIAHDLVHALGNDTAEKWEHMLRFSSYLSVQRCDSSYANISWCKFFSRENKLLFSRGFANWGGDDKKR